MEQFILPGLLVFLVYREIMHDRRVNALMDRLMARDLPEFKAETAPEDNEIADPVDDGTIEIDQAEEALIGNGEEN